MPAPDPKDDFRRYLQIAREALVWKLGTALRRRAPPVGADRHHLPGLVKHVASVEAGYLGDTFGRPYLEPLPWLAEDAEANADMWATADESRDEIVAFIAGSGSTSDITIDTMPLDVSGHVPWWPADRRKVTLHRILLHMIAETDRHVGHADIVRELIDGAAGLRADVDNMAPGDAAWWSDYRQRLEDVAQQFVGR